MSRRRKSFAALLFCYLIWGTQPVYWDLLSGFNAMFVLCCRIIMSAICTVLFLACSGRLREYLSAFKNRRLMRYLLPAAVFLCVDWGLFNWAVMSGHVIDTALGYYLNPIVIFVIGLVFFRERGSAMEYSAVAIATLGVVISTVQNGSFPLISVLCALSWPIYASTKKAAGADPIVSVAVESTLLSPFAIAASLLFFRGSGGLGSVSGGVDVLLLVVSGLVTATPMILYTYAVDDLPFKVVGIMQYLSSTISFACGILFLNEEVTASKLVMFGFIVAGLVVFTAGSFRRQSPQLSLPTE